jgi:4-amino-4-deoxy-L-arabinose transferase-like glycosyltransferase
VAVSQTPRRTRLIFAALILLAAFAIATLDSRRDSLWFDEAYTMYIVRDEGRPPDGLTDTARFVFNSLRGAVQRAGEDVHPPLYFVLFDVWSLLTGESAFAARLPSAFASLIGLAATYALGKHLFDSRTGLIAAALLGTASILVYYNREARMYTLLLALAALATLAYLRWREHPTRWRILIYGLLLTLLLYTHYAGALILLTHALHLLLTRPRMLLRMLVPVGMALTLFAAWIPSALWQLNTHGGPAAPPFTRSDVALTELVFFFTGGYWLLYLIPLVAVIPHIRRHTHTLTLLLVWLLVTPLALLLLNTWIPAVYQVRYSLGMLPAGALLVAWGIRSISLPPQHFRLPLAIEWRGGWGVRFLFLAILIYTQLTVYPAVWPTKSRWDEAVRQMTSTRQPQEPAITAIPAHTPAAYYDRVYGIRRGVSLDLAWRWQEPSDMAAYATHMSKADSVWVVMPSTYVSTWDGLRDLLADRHVGYRDTVMDMIFYRLDSGAAGDLDFRFADQWHYEGGIRHHLYAIPDEDLCFTFNLIALADIAPGSSIDFELTQGYGTVRQKIRLDLDTYAAGDTAELAPCIPVSADNPAGPHHLRARIYDASGGALPLLEGDDLYWGDVLMFALVSVG